MKALDTALSGVLRRAETGRQEGEVSDLKKRIEQAKEAIVLDRMSGMAKAVGWKTVDAICTIPGHARFGYSWLAAATIAHCADCNEETVRSGWKINIERGHIVRERKGGAGNPDWFSLPPDRGECHGQDASDRGECHGQDCQDLGLTVENVGSDRGVLHDNPTYDPPYKKNSLGKTIAPTNGAGRANASARDAYDDSRARRLARKHGVDVDACKKLIAIERQVHERFGSEAVVPIKQEGGESYIRARIDGYTDRLVELDEREAIEAEAEAAGGVIADKPAIDDHEIPL